MIIRDMGYFVLKSLKQIINKEAHFITPLRMDVKLYHPKNGKEIKLKNLVGNKQILKKTVLLGKEEKLPVTLIAIKVSRKTAESRRKRAILDRDRRKKNTIDKLYLLGWEIFVCSTNEISIENVKKIYGLRWQIEIIFKSWKSHLNIQKNIPTQLKRPFLPQAILLMSLLLAVVFIMPLYHKLSAMDKTTGISLLKLTLLITTGIAGIDWIIDLKKSKHLMYLSRYEKRKRRSFSDKIQSLS
jgi:cytochrome c oxidase subunit IV